MNVEFIQPEPDGSVRMRVWERGVGETQACGTGATAVGAAAVRLGLASEPGDGAPARRGSLIEVGAPQTRGRGRCGLARGGVYRRGT